MLILSIDTAGAYISVALNEDETVLAAKYEALARGQAELLVPMIEELYKQAGKAVNETDAIAVAVGPGSFTGVRIGLAAARGFGLALQKPVWGISNFQTAAFGVNEPCIVALTTRRGDFYTKRFSVPEADVAEILTKEQIEALGLPIITDEPEAFESPLNKLLPFCADSARVLAKIALTQKENVLPPEAYYMRPADVTVKTG